MAAARAPLETNFAMHDKLSPARERLAVPAAAPARERRPAVWPWLVMPLIVLLVYYALFRVHQQPAAAPEAPDSSPAATQSAATHP
jgi:hypothetical protein